MSHIDEAVLLRALQQRMLEEIARKQESGIVNNVYGGGGPSGSTLSGGGAAGIAAAMQGDSPASSSEDPFDYYVNINRRDVFDPADPEGKKKLGWDKEVHRYRKPKEDDGGKGGKKHPKAKREK